MVTADRVVTVSMECQWLVSFSCMHDRFVVINYGAIANLASSHVIRKNTVIYTAVVIIWGYAPV